MVFKRYVFIGSIGIVLCMSLHAMDGVYEKIQWSWVNFWYADRSKEAKFACKDFHDMMQQLEQFSASTPERQEVHTGMKSLLEQHIKVCDMRTRVRALPRNPQVTKLMRQGDKHLLASYVQVKHFFILMQDEQQNNN